MNYNNPMVELKENKIIISDSAMNYLSITIGDRLSINYVQDKFIYPVIGKSKLFGDQESGSKVTKSKTFSFRGLQNKVLARYGNLFILIPDNIITGAFKLQPIDNNMII